MTVHIALYGTLRHGQPMLLHFAGAALQSGAMRWLGPCRIPGLLVDCGAYPALIEPGAEAPGVAADLFAIDDMAVLAALDAYEDYDPADPDASEYLRLELPLIGTASPAAPKDLTHTHAYVWNRAPVDLPVIESGDWLAHVGEAPREPPRERPGGRQ